MLRYALTFPLKLVLILTAFTAGVLAIISLALGGVISRIEP